MFIFLLARPALVDHSQTGIAFAQIRMPVPTLYRQGTGDSSGVDFRFRKFINLSRSIMPSRWPIGIASYYSKTTFQAFDMNDHDPNCVSQTYTKDTRRELIVTFSDDAYIGVKKVTKNSQNLMCENYKIQKIKKE